MIVRTHNTICSGVDETSFNRRPLELEAAPTTSLMRLGFGVDVDAVYVVMYSAAAIEKLNQCEIQGRSIRGSYSSNYAPPIN